MDVSIIINAHQEGPLLASAIKSVKQNIQQCKTKENFEVVLIADNPDYHTSQALNLIDNSIKVHEVRYSDLSSSRNFGIKNTEGEYIAFLDGDDIWSHNWLESALSVASRRVILHPEYNFFFGTENFIQRHIGMSDAKFDINLMRIANYWTSLSFAHRSIYENISYLSNDLKNGYGFEDWTWNCDSIAAGYTHEIVSNTAHFIRKKRSGSLLLETYNSYCLPRPNKLFHLV